MDEAGVEFASGVRLLRKRNCGRRVSFDMVALILHVQRFKEF